MIDELALMIRCLLYDSVFEEKDVLKHCVDLPQLGMDAVKIVEEVFGYVKSNKGRLMKSMSRDVRTRKLLRSVGF
jgi:hypothetical protein